MPTTLDRTSCDDRLGHQPRAGGCCDPMLPCADCRVRIDEDRAARRDALLHALAQVRPRRVRQLL